MIFEYTGAGCSVPKDITGVKLNEGLKKIGISSFINCSLLESIKLPSTLVEIGFGAFQFCSKLREIVFNDGLQKIGNDAFFKCTSLESITLPSTVTEIGNFAFNGCSNLREVKVSDGLQNIGDRAFVNCTSLESITLPSSVIEIGNNAFSGCSNLMEVELNGAPQYLKSDAFSNCDALERVLFPTISYRLVNIIQTSHWEELVEKVNQVRGVVQWETDELFVSTARIIFGHWNDARMGIGRITRLVSYYELKEATTTFELALWKSKLDQADATNTTNRAAYRIDVPGPVKDTILQFLDCN